MIFIVWDTGVGIKEDGQKDLFGEFMKGEDEMQLNKGGSGLGLNICRKIV